MCIAFGMVNAAMRAFFKLVGNRLGLFFLFLAGLLGLLVAGNLFAAVKKLEALPDDNDNKRGEKDFRKTQHVRSQSTDLSATSIAATVPLY